MHRSARRTRTAVLAFVAAVLVAGAWSPPASATTGGPDGSGYTFSDSFEPGGPTGGFIEIGELGGGKDIGLHCDDCIQRITAPFPVTFYGRTVRNLNVSSDGNVQIGSGYVGPALQGLPDPRLASAMLPFSADLTTDTDGDSVSTATLGQAPHRIFVIQWNAHTFRTGIQERFEVVLTEGSRNVEYYYNGIDDSVPSTVGIQGNRGADGNYLTYPGSVSSVSGVGFTTPGDPVSGTTTSLVVSPGPGSTNTQRVRLSARITPVSPGGPAPTGTVVFFSELGEPIGSAQVLPSGRAVLTTTELRPRIPYFIAASYGGDANYSSSTSYGALHYVSAAQVDVAIKLPDPATISASTPVQATAAVRRPGRGPADVDLIWSDARTGQTLAQTFVQNGVATLPGGVLPVTAAGGQPLLLQAEVSAPPGTFYGTSKAVHVRVTAD